MREHLTKMTEIKERLAEMNRPEFDKSFVSYIRASLPLVPNQYRTLFEQYVPDCEVRTTLAFSAGNL
jgi:hypothetical protein